jgi:hypothetical protein
VFSRNIICGHCEFVVVLAESGTEWIIHTIDGILVKVAIAVFLVYVLFYKERWRDIVCMTAILLLFVFAAMSHYFSSKKWCSPEHLFCHGGFHFACSLSSAYAFI